MKAKRILCTCLGVLAGCAESPKAPQMDVNAEPGFATPRIVTLEPARVTPLPIELDLERLLAAMGSEDVEERDAAEEGLVAFGELALPGLDAMASSTDPEVVARAARAARRVRLGDALWLADLVEIQFQKYTSQPNVHHPPMDSLLEKLRNPLGPVLRNHKAYRLLLDELSFAEKFMVDPERCARIDAVIDAHPAISDQIVALLEEVAKDPEFQDKRHRRAVAEVVRLHILGLQSDDVENIHAVLGLCRSWTGTQAALVLPAVAHVARRHPNPQVCGIARGYLLDLLAEGRDWYRGGPPEIWPGPVPHTSRLAPLAKDLVPWMMELASKGNAGERSWALRAVGHIGDHSIVPAVMKAFREDPAVRDGAFRALVTLGAPEAREALLEVLQNPGDAALLPALFATAHLRPAEAHDRVAAILDASPGGEVERAAANALCTMAQPGDLPRLARIIGRWTEKTGFMEAIPAIGAVLRLKPPDSPDRRTIAASCEVLLKSESGSIRLFAALMIESFDARAGVRAWAGLLDDFTLTDGGLRFPISWVAVGSLERLTSVAFRGGEGVQTQDWRDWWKEHSKEYDAPR